MEEMVITDYLLMNTDRHLRNFGVIQNVETLEWVSTVPVFDTGQSMFCGVPTDRLPYEKVSGKLFSHTSKDFETYPCLISTMRTIDLSRLTELPDEYGEMMRNTASLTGISEECIVFLTRTLATRI